MNSNKKLVPEAKEALDKFKMEAANEVGVSLKKGYNGDLTSKQAGSVGGQMVKNVTTARRLNFKRIMRNTDGHEVEVKYIAAIMV